MALLDFAWYVNFGNGFSTGYFKVAVWAASTTYTVGQIVRQRGRPLAEGSERCFVCVASTGGTGQSGASEPAWTTTRGGKTTDNTVTWMECTGIPALNGDHNTAGNGAGVNQSMATWTLIKGTTISLGQCLISLDGTKVVICTTAGTDPGTAEPTWPAYTTAGATVTSGATWTTIGTIGGANDFAVGGAPHSRITNVLSSTWYAAGNTVYMADSHQEWCNNAITTPSVSSPSRMGQVLSYDSTIGSLPPGPGNLTKGKAAIVQTGANNSLTLGNHSMYWYGINFVDGACTAVPGNILLNHASGATVIYDNCNFICQATANSSFQEIAVGAGNATPSEIIMNNCQVSFNGFTIPCYMSQGYATWRWQNTRPVLGQSVQFTGYSGTTGATFTGFTATTGGTASALPVPLYNTGVIFTNGLYGGAYWEGLDLSQCTNGILGFNSNNQIGFLQIKDSKLPAGMTQTGLFNPSWPQQAGFMLQLINCTGQTGNYTSHFRASMQGYEQTEPLITRQGGAIDPNGNAISRKYVMGAAANPSPTGPQFLLPYRAEALAAWNKTTGATCTVSVFGTWSGTTGPFNTDIWIEVEYPGGTTGYSEGTYLTSGLGLSGGVWAAVLQPTGAGVQYPSDNSTWNNAAGSPWSAFKMSVVLGGPTGTLPPQVAGPITVRPKIGRTGSTFYLDPKVVFS